MGLLKRQKTELAAVEHAIETEPKDDRLNHILDMVRHRLARVEDKLAAQTRTIDHTHPLPRAGIDFAFGAPTPLDLRRSGVTFVARYLGGSVGKDLTSEQAEDLSHAGIELVTVFESTANRAALGAHAGAADAKQAEQQLHKIGAPADAPVYFAVDFDASRAELAQVFDYLRAAADVLGRNRTGVYGSLIVVAEALARNIVTYGWQTYAWSDGQWASRAQLRQVQNDVTVAGITCDRDEAVAADFGQWVIS